MLGSTLFRRVYSLKVGIARGNFSTLQVSREAEHVLIVSINRPHKSNAMNKDFFEELKQCFLSASDDLSCRAIVLMAEGKNFSAGIDLEDFSDLLMLKKEPGRDVARDSHAMFKLISNLQASFQAVANCSKPVIAAIQGACIGGGVDLVLAADIRLCEKHATFCVKEVDIGICPDLGTIQLLPKAVGSDSLARELIYTARHMPAVEADSCGFVSRVLPDVHSLHAVAIEIASTIAQKSPVAVHGSKLHLNFARDHSVADALNYQAMWNSSMLQGVDVPISVKAAMKKIAPVYPDF